MEAPSLADIRGAHVLIVDSNQTTREVMLAYLRVWGVHCSAVADGQAALDYLRFAAAAAEPVQIAIIDATVADGDGITLGRALRSAERQQPPTLILTSAAARAANTSAARAAGFTGHLAKPTVADELRAAIVAALNQPTRHSPLPERAAADANGTRPRCMPAPLRAQTLLLVDHNRLTQEVVRGLLAQWAYALEIVADAAMAESALSKRDFLMVLINWHLPNADTYALCHAIRSGTGGIRQSQIPIIALGSRVSAEVRTRGLAAGASDFVTTPLDSAELKFTIAHWTKHVPATVATKVGSDDDHGFDHRALLELLGGERELFVRVMRCFVEDMPARLAAIAAAIECNDTAAVARDAQAVDSAAENICALGLRAQAAALAMSALTGDLSAAPAAYAALEHEFAAVFQLLLRLGVSVPNSGEHRGNF